MNFYIPGIFNNNNPGIFNNNIPGIFIEGNKKYPKKDI